MPRTLEDLPDIINVSLEQLVWQPFELPAFPFFQRPRGGHRECQSLLRGRLETAARERLCILLTRVDNEIKSSWHRSKPEPKQVTAQKTRGFPGLAWFKLLVLSKVQGRLLHYVDNA